MNPLLEHLAQTLAPYRGCRRWLIAYSGGLDSRVLLQALVELKRELPDLPALQAIHINHQLQADAQSWAEQAQRVCETLRVPLLVHTITVEHGGRRSLEAAARAARYRVFESVVAAGDALLMAHHRDDQVETLMLRLLRGSGLAGQGGMPAVRPLAAGRLVRPLLDIDRAQLLAFAEQRDLNWVDDPSNSDVRFDRNYLRHEILPRLAFRWPGYRETLSRAARLSAEGAQLLDELAAQDLAGADESLAIAPLLALTPARRRNALRYWLYRRGIEEVSTMVLEQIEGTVLAAREDAQPELALGDRQLRRYRGALFVTALQNVPDVAWSEPWALEAPLALPGGGALHARPVVGAGLRSSPALVEVRLRRGGERCRPTGRDHSQTLKKLLQQYELPPWWRDRLPLVYVNGELAAVADLWICAGFGAGPDEAGWQLQWHRGA